MQTSSSKHSGERAPSISPNLSQQKTDRPPVGQVDGDDEPVHTELSSRDVSALSFITGAISNCFNTVRTKILEVPPIDVALSAVKQVVFELRNDNTSS